MEVNKMTYTVLYHPDVKKTDLPKIDNKFKKSIREAIETRLSKQPHIYGKPLQRTLKGYWKLRVGSYRIIYKISDEEIFILCIIHRKAVYAKIQTRKG
jgi:mRNA interferase RelE/StbE